MKCKGYFLFLIVSGCSGLQKTEHDSQREQNATTDLIYRKSNEVVYVIPPVEPRVREKYPWECKEERSQSTTAQDSR